MARRLQTVPARKPPLQPHRPRAKARLAPQGPTHCVRVPTRTGQNRPPASSQKGERCGNARAHRRAKHTPTTGGGANPKPAPLGAAKNDQSAQTPQRLADFASPPGHSRRGRQDAEDLVPKHQRARTYAQLPQQRATRHGPVTLCAAPAQKQPLRHTRSAKKRPPLPRATPWQEPKPNEMARPDTPCHHAQQAPVGAVKHNKPSDRH